VYLVVFKGLAGTGKSTLSRALGRHFGWLVLDKDDIHDAIETDANNATPLAYRILFRMVETALEQGFSVICDCSLRGQEGLENVKALAQRTKAEPVIIECITTDESVWRSRFEARTGLSSRRLTDWQEYEPLIEGARTDMAYEVDVPHLVVDTSRPLEATVVEALHFLETLGTVR
jgi:predicted kinase